MVGGARNADPLMCFMLPTFAPLETERETERERATVCILHDAGAIALGTGVPLVDELLDLHHLVQSLRPLSTLILQSSMHENRLSLRDLLSITLPFSCSSFFLHNTHSLPLASSSSDAAQQTCVVNSGSHPKRTREGADAAAFPVVEFCNSVRKKKKQRLGSELLKISRESWSIVGRLQLWNRSTSSVADLQRDHRTIDCLALTDGEISICCSVASLHPQFLGQLVQVSILCVFSPAF
jgi:hypothetical protein